MKTLTKSEILEQLGKRLRTVRDTRGWTQQELADKAGLHRTYIADLECGNRNVTIGTLCRLIQPLEIPLSEFCSGIGLRHDGKKRKGNPNPRVAP